MINVVCVIQLLGAFQTQTMDYFIVQIYFFVQIHTTDLCSCQMCFHLLYLVLSVGQSAQFSELVDVQDFPVFFGRKGQDIKLICVWDFQRTPISQIISNCLFPPFPVSCV